jgi:serine/threonine protein kinase/Tol biopolymer transport system component
MPLSDGTRLGRYEIRSKIGEGGMGEVYLAQDTKLDRKVALKILTADVASHRDRMSRFVQEAKAASALNHPNIITIYEIEEIDSVNFIATEFIDGETLRERMRSAPMSFAEVLDVAIQTASALSAAHAANIVHRDIKPENIMIRGDGIVKVLDFGLAKLTAAESATVDTQVPTRFKTDPGTVVGTAIYMSPEQARGMPVDARTDIFSLGVVLYEVVAGRLPFEGSTSGEVVAAILSEKKPQPLARYSREVPAELERIVSKALRKNRDERYQTIKDLLVDLKDLKRELELQAQLERRVASELGSRATTEISEPAMAETAPTQVAQTGADSTARTTSSAEYIVSQIKSHKRGIAIAVAALIVIAGGLAFWLYRLIGQNKAPSSSQAMKITRLTSTGKSRLAVISADGKYVLHVIEDAGKQSLWMRQTSIESNVQILAPADGSFGGLTFSRDGNYIYYIWGEKGSVIQTLYQLPVLGGEPRKLITDIASAVTFSPDGKQVSFIRNTPSAAQSALMSANADGSGEKTLATRKEPDEYVGTPAWSPDGKTIAVPVHGKSGGQHTDVVVVPAAGGQEKPLGTQRWILVGQLAWLADGSALLMDAAEQNSYFGSQLYEVSYPGGQVRRITNDLNNYGGVSLTEDSSALVTVQGDSPTSLWVAPEGKAERARQLSPGTGNYEGFVGVDWTPDGKVIFTSYAGCRAQLWIIGADASGRKQLTVDGQFNLWPGVSPDGKYIVFASNRSGGYSIWRMDADGGNERQLTRGGLDYEPRISPDGKWVVFTGQREGKFVILKVSIEGGEPVQVTPRQGYAPVISPDGKWIAFHLWGEGGKKSRQAVMPFEGGEPTKFFDQPGRPGWARDSKGLIYKEAQGGVDNLWLQPLDGGKPKQLTNFTSDQIWYWAWSRDGKQLTLSRYSTTSDVVLISGFR